MLDPEHAPSSPSPLHIREASSEDLPAVLALFDSAVAWLGEQGLQGQWGTTPFSQLPAMVARFTGWIKQQTFYVAYRDGATVGTIVLSPTPPAYAAALCMTPARRALYLEALVTDRRAARQGIGRTILQWTEEHAIQQGIEWLRLDCWAGNAGLRHYYARAGFEECEEFVVGDWRGVLFEKRVQDRLSNSKDS